jgi:hypothetical protein
MGRTQHPERRHRNRGCRALAICRDFICGEVVQLFGRRNPSFVEGTRVAWEAAGFLQERQ